MIHRLPLLLRRSLAVALLMAALGLISLVTVVPFLSQLATAREQLSQSRATLGRLLETTKTSTIAEQLEQGAQGLKTTGLFIEGESDSIRLAALQSQVVDIVGAHGVKPRTARMLQSSERYNLRLAGVELQLTATIEQVQKILLQIEAHRPILLVDTLHLTPTTAANSEDDRGQLDVRLNVIAIESRSSEAKSTDARLKVP
jgi:Type II secretion system (T2SS), protein M subtype b